MDTSDSKVMNIERDVVYIWIFAFVMIVLIESSIFGLYGSEHLVFGWLPIQLAYDIFYTLVLAPVFLYLVYRQTPDITDVESIEEGN